MYTSIPIEEGISITIRYLKRYKHNLFGLSLDNICDLLTNILNNNVYSFNDKFYIQFNSLAMGSRIAPTIAIITLDSIERQTIYNFPGSSIKLFKRYVDIALFFLTRVQTVMLCRKPSTAVILR